MNKLTSLLSNGDSLDLDATRYYAAILGETPSQGARSPVLWNAAFQQEDISAFMHPMDIQSDRLENVVSALKNDSRFIGGAVTMPYKIDILPFLDKVEPEAKIIGAVNCIYRSQDGLVGTNTDGAGALWSLTGKLKKSSEDLKGKKIVLIGTGGAGSAVATYIAKEIGLQGTILLSNRSKASADILADKLRAVCKSSSIGWPITSSDVADTDIIINCSSIGFENMLQDGDGFISLRPYTSIGLVDKTAHVSANTNAGEKAYFQQVRETVKENLNQAMEILIAAKSPMVFDIIYQPEETVLLFLASLAGCNTLNGREMNLEQAVIAYDMTTVATELRSSDRDLVRSTMSKV